MRLSEDFFYTLREDVSDEDSVSGKLLVKSGMIKKVSNGVYAKTPLGTKAFQNVEEIVRRNMNNAGADELKMPMLLPMDFFEKSGRKNAFGPSMFRSTDRYNREYALGPTHEELFAFMSMSRVKSYRDLPYTLYQIGTKFRDEVRPRLGLIRVREFTMKDAYSFDKDYEGLDVSYKKMFDAYHKIFTELGLNYTVVRADTGVMGGILSEEFQAITDVGEDILVLCENCDFSSNIEVTPCICNEECNEEEKELEMVDTKNYHTIDEICDYLKLDIKKTVKALLMSVDNELVVFFVRGDRELNEVKALKVLKGKEIGFATDELIATSNAVPGCTGPIGLNAKIVVDNEVLKMKNFCCGANKEGYHYINANIKDINYDIVSDIINVKENDICPNCGGKLYFKKGIEIGNTFKLGTKYSEALNLNYTDELNQLKPVVMGSYGIGLGRCMAAIVEQNNDDKGIIWPIEVAPFKCAIIIANTKDTLQVELANKIYDNLIDKGIEPLLDDRDERMGVKLNDIDLIGIPIRIVVGRKAVENIIELKRRDSEEVFEINIENIIEYIK